MNELFNSAVDRGAEAEDFLQAECAGDTDLYSAVHRMLQEHARTGLLERVPRAASPEFLGTGRFEVRRLLGAGGMGAVYEVWDRELSQSVALKTLLRVNPDDILRFKREFRTLSAITHPALIPLYELISDSDQWFFTMELLDDAKPLMPHRGGRTTTATMFPLAGFPEIPEVPAKPVLNPPYLSQVRDRFRQLAEAVTVIHRAGILHRDLKPSNVMVRRSGAVVVLDFGLATDLAATRPCAVLDGAPAMAMTSASSWPDLGTAAGTLPYMAPEQVTGGPLTEASDWYAFGVTLYQALTGQRPFEEDSGNLLQRKVSEDGFSPSRLSRQVPPDLDALVAGLLRRNPQERPTGEEVLAAFRGSVVAPRAGGLAELRTFLGREAELSAMRRALEKLDSGATVVVQLFGPSGFGKSAVLGRFLELVSELDRVLVLRGRCYEQESMPYKAIDSIMDSLALYLTRLSPSDQGRLLPEGIGALARLFPVLRRLPGVAIGPVDYEGTLSGGRREAFEALRELLRRIGERCRLVISVDDVQWADQDSAVLLDEAFGSSGAPRAMLICSYRSENAFTSVFPRHLDALIASKPPHLLAAHIELRPLGPEDSRELALRLLAGQPDAETQARAIAEAAGGSPYFITELVRHIQDGIAVSPYRSPDLDSALRRRVELLPEASQRLLAVVALAAGPIEFRNAREACEIAFEPLHALAELRNAHLLRTSGAGGRNLEIETYHDRVREAIVAGLTEETRLRHHARLATVLEAGGSPAETVAFHCEQAGFTAKAYVLYGQAASDSIHSLALDRAQTLLRRAAQVAPDLQSRTAALERLIHLQTNLARFGDAYETGREATRANGFFLPPRFTPPLFLLDLLRFMWLRRGKTFDQLRRYPEAIDPRTQSAMRLMAAVGKAAYQLRPELCISVMTRIVNLSLKHGMTRDSAIGFIAFGAIFLGGILGRHRAGREFGQLSLDLVERYNNDAQRAEINFVVGYFGTSWLRPSCEAEALWRTAFESGKASGDLFHTGCAACAIVLSMFMRGDTLDNIWTASETYFELLSKYHLKEPEGAIRAVRQAIRNLRGLTPDPASLTDGDFDELEFENQLDRYGSRHLALYYYVAKMQVLVLRGLYREALIASATTGTLARESRGMLHWTELFFYTAFALLARDQPLSFSEARRARSTWRKFRRWEKQCPANFRSRERLLAAEFEKRRAGDALTLYHQAAAAAGEQGHVHIQALAEHRAAVFLDRQGCHSDAAVRRISAQSLYLEWGATALAHPLLEARKGGYR